MSANSESGPGLTSATSPLFIPFHTGPSLAHIPDDVLHEILSYLPSLTKAHVFFAYRTSTVDAKELQRTPVLRALSQTSRLLRSRCLGMAWSRVELCGFRERRGVVFHIEIGKATRAAVRVLSACPHLLPLIQTVAVVMTRFECNDIIPAFANYLATLPNITTIHVIHAHPQMATTIKNAFEGKRFPSVRKISLPSSAHHIIQSCPNLEDVLCVEGNGSTLVGSIVQGNCHQVRILKGVYAPLKRLVKVLPDLRHIDLPRKMLEEHATRFASFPLLDTIEIADYWRYGRVIHGAELTETDPELEQVIKILKENKSQADKTVILTKFRDIWSNRISKTIKV